MRLKLTVAAIPVLALTLAACGGGSGASSVSAGHAHGGSAASRSRPTRIYRVHLSGAAGALHGATGGTGAAIIAFHGDSLVCWRFAHLHGFTNPTMAQIETGARSAARSAGPASRSDTVVLGLSRGRRLHHQGCVRITPALTSKIWHQPSRYDVSIDSTQYPAGAVRAQL